MMLWPRHVRLGKIFTFFEYLHVCFAMKPAHNFGFKRINVVDVMFDSCLLRQPRGFAIDGSNSVVVGPSWGGQQDSRAPRSGAGIYIPRALFLCRPHGGIRQIRVLAPVCSGPVDKLVSVFLVIALSVLRHVFWVFRPPLCRLISDSFSIFLMVRGIGRQILFSVGLPPKAGFCGAAFLTDCLFTVPGPDVTEKEVNRFDLTTGRASLCEHGSSLSWLYSTIQTACARREILRIAVQIGHNVN